MAIEFSCEQCGRTLKVKDELAGRKGKCPGCGVVITIPEGPPQGVAAQTPETTTTVPPVESAPAGYTKPCVHCGKSLPVAAIFCVHCGTNLRTGQKHAAGEGTEGDSDQEYDYFKVAPDMLTRPMAAVGTIVDHPPTVANFKKACIFLAIGLLVFTIFAPYTSYNNSDAVGKGFKGNYIKLWHYPIIFIFACLAVLVDGVLCNVAGSSFGSTGVRFASVFISVMTARALVGMSLLLVGLLLYSVSSMPGIIMGVGMVIRLGWGAFLVYAIIFRSYDTGPVPAAIFAVLSSVVRGLLFWLASLLIGPNLI